MLKITTYADKINIVYQAERKEGVLALVPKATLPPPPKVGTIL